MRRVNKLLFIVSLFMIFAAISATDSTEFNIKVPKGVEELLQRNPTTTSVKIIGLVPAHNEQNIITQCLQGLSLYTDAIVFLDDASDDNSFEIVESLKESCNVVSIIRKTKWHREEPENHNKLLTEGRKLGGTHFIVIDADELFTANFLDNHS